MSQRRTLIDSTQKLKASLKISLVITILLFFSLQMSNGSCCNGHTGAQRRVFLWAIPRSISTAFFRAMMTSSDIKVRGRDFYYLIRMPELKNAPMDEQVVPLFSRLHAVGICTYDESNVNGQSATESANDVITQISRDLNDKWYDSDSAGHVSLSACAITTPWPGMSSVT
jgi:hypothetical protein